MNARMKHPTALIPAARQAIFALGKAADNGTVPARTHFLIHLRSSQLNGCTFCVDMHSREMKKAGDADERIWAVAAWRDSPLFNDTERAALALTEAVTRLDERDPVPDHVWNEAARNYDENGLASLLLSIATINVWNRLNVPIKHPPAPAAQ